MCVRGDALCDDYEDRRKFVNHCSSLAWAVESVKSEANIQNICHV